MIKKIIKEILLEIHNLSKEEIDERIIFFKLVTEYMSKIITEGLNYREDNINLNEACEKIYKLSIENRYEEELPHETFVYVHNLILKYFSDISLQ
jgi:hypothetical protein